MDNLIIINGPNLNLTGERETKFYGKVSFEDFLESLRLIFPTIKIDYFQSNVEGEIINRMQEAMLEHNAIILNAAAYTHTSVAIGDTVRAIDIPVVEVHISNVFQREDFRHVSFITPHCIGSVSGFGFDSYRMAIEHLIRK